MSPPRSMRMNSAPMLRSRSGVAGRLAGSAAIASDRSRGNSTGYLFRGVVAGADQGSGLHVPESHLQPQPPQAHELGRRVVLVQRQVLAARAQVLADGEHIDVLLSEQA